MTTEGLADRNSVVYFSMGLRHQRGPGVVQWVEELATKQKEPSLILSTHMVEGENWKLSLTSTCVLGHTQALAQAHEIK